ncbi:MAG: hypothetical protein ACQEQH_06975 [Bacillota bacterium]
MIHIKNKKLLIITAVSGGLAGFAVSNIDSWFYSIMIALLIGLSVGFLGTKFFSDDNK